MNGFVSYPERLTRIPATMADVPVRTSSNVQCKETLNVNGGQDRGDFQLQ
jgi:hypothetical protein